MGRNNKRDAISTQRKRLSRRITCNFELSPHLMSNLDILTKGHSAIAFKKKGKQGHIKEILFDDEARRCDLFAFLPI